MRKINSQEFLQGLNREGVENCIILNSVEVVNSELFTESIVISNCTFEQSVLISDCSFKGSLIFKDCIFKSDFKIHSCCFDYLCFDGENFKTVNFSGLIKKFSTGKIQFVKGVYEKLLIEAVLFECELEVNSITVEEIILLHTEFENKIRFDGTDLKIKTLFVEKNNFDNRLDFVLGSVYEMFHMRSSIFNGTVLFYLSFHVKMFLIGHIFSKLSFTINYLNNINSLSINSSTFDGEFHCHKPYNNEKVKGDLSVYLDGLLKGKLIFSDISINSFDVAGTNLGVITINNISIGDFSIVSFSNLNSFMINNLSPNMGNSYFVIDKSNVGKIELLNTNLKKFDEVVIVNSNVSDIVLSNSVLPEKIQIANKDSKIGYGPSEELELKEASFFRETYRQLRIALEKQGNQSLALSYKAKEFYFLRKELPFGWDKMLLYLNYISNNHGISWSRGVFFTLGTAFVFFTAYNLTLTESSKYFFWTLNTSGKETWQASIIGFDGYIDFLLSFPKVVVNEEPPLRSSSKVIILLARIFMGYGIYQTISAFRKYGKS